MSDCEGDDQKLEIEDQFILRLPLKQATKLHQILQTKPKKIKKLLAIDLDVEKKTGTVTFNKKQLPAKLVNLPTVVESNKCYDGVHLFKTADVLQMLVCGDLVNKTGTGHDHPHGLAPPLKNVRKKRFRKTQRNRNVDVDEEEVEKELLWLLRMDNEAVSSKFEFFYEATNNNNKENKTRNGSNTIDECEIFGSVISEDSDQDSSGSVNDIMEYTN